MSYEITGGLQVVKISVQQVVTNMSFILRIQIISIVTYTSE